MLNSQRFNRCRMGYWCRGARLQFLIRVTVLLLPFWVMSVGLSHAGTVESAFQGGFRPFLEGGYSRNIAGIDRLNVFYVYAEPGEKIQLASSALGVYKGDILYTPPSGSETSCLTEHPDEPTRGRIHSLQEELNGSSVAGGYIPCEVEVDDETAGIWKVTFLGPDPEAWKSSKPISISQPWIQAEDVYTIAAWDIGVLGTDGTEKEGRFFFEHLPLSMGDVQAPLILDLFVLTADGYVYEVGLNGIQSHTFTFFANRDGFVNTENEDPLYQSVYMDWTNVANKSLPPGVHIEGPAGSLALEGEVHKLFLHPPADDLPRTVLTPEGTIDFGTDPSEPVAPQTFLFNGTPESGGTFSYEVNVEGRYRIELDVNKNGVWGDGNDVVLHHSASPGMNFVLWDGTDAQGRVVHPSEGGYSARIRHAVGEMHLPFIDIEENANGVNVSRINGFGATPSKVYYDDSAFFVDAAHSVNQAVRHGEDSERGVHSIADNFGNGKGIDTWTYLLSTPVPLKERFFDLKTDVRLSLSASQHTPSRGESVEVVLDIHNDGPNATSAVRVELGIPASFIAEQPQASSGEFNLDTHVWFIESLPASGGERLTIPIASNEDGTFPVIAEVIDFAGEDIDSSPNNWDLVFQPLPQEDDEDRVDIIVEPDPSIGISKRVVEQVGDPRDFTVHMEVVVENLGNTPLDNVQVFDLLPDAFHGTDYTISDVHVSAPFELNAQFDGKIETRFFSSEGVELAVGEKIVITYSARVIPFTSLGPYLSSAEVRALGPNDSVVEDISNDGHQSDPNGNGHPGDSGEDEPTKIEVTQRPALGLAMEISEVVGDVTDFSAICDIYIENLGDVFLEDIQVELELAGVFGTNQFEVVSIETGDNIKINTGYTGSGTGKYLIESGRLGVSKTAKVSIAFNASPPITEGYYFLQAIGRAVSPGGVQVEDYSDNGKDPDANNNLNASDLGERDPAVIAFDEKPVVGASLVAERVTGDLGGFTGYYVLTIHNLGDVPLYDVKALNDLDKVFPGSNYEVIEVSSLNGITPNQAFNGSSVKNLVVSQDRPLSPGASFTLKYVVEVQPQSYFGPYNNSIAVYANSLAGVLVSDISDSGAIVDSDGDNNPDEEGENDAHELRFAPNASLGAALATNSITGDLKQFNVSYDIIVENKGDVPVLDLSIRHVLDSTFTDAQIEILRVSTEGDLVLNAHFDGVNDDELLDLGQNQLNIGERATIALDVQVKPNQHFGPYFMGALVEGKTPFGTSVSDRSNSGTQPDPDGNGNPSDPGEDQPSLVNVLEKPVVGASFDAYLLESGPSAFNVRHVIRVQNLGDVPLNQLQMALDLTDVYKDAEIEVIRRYSRGDLAIQEDYNGIDQAELLEDVGVLQVADTFLVEIDAEVKPSNFSRSYLAGLTVSAKSPGGVHTYDISDSGRLIDRNENGLANETGENRPTEIVPGTNPAIGLAKMVSRLTELPNELFELEYTYIVQNLGDVVLSGVTVIEDLESIFGKQATSVVSIGVSDDSPLKENSGFNGGSVVDMLDPERSSLNPGEYALVFLVVRTTEVFNLAEVQSGALVRAIDPTGVEVEDISNDGFLVDPNGNGSAGDSGENKPTNVIFNNNDALEFETWLTNIEGDSTGFNASFKATISNLSYNEFNNVQLILDLTQGAEDLNVRVKSISISSDESLVLSDNFNGKTSTNLLDALSSTMPSGSTAHVWVDLTFTGASTASVKDISFLLKAENVRGEPIEQFGSRMPVFVETSAGKEAGLESDGDLANLLAQRMYRKNQGETPKGLDAKQVSFKLHLAGAKGVHGTGALNEWTNLELVPAKGPGNSDAIVQTPEDLFGVTNATSVLAIDYMTNQQRVAGLFATTTPAGETYEHSKNICDRLKGADLKNVEIVSIRGYPFVRSTLVHDSGEVDYAISFISYNKEVSYLVDSRFIPDEYVVDQSGAGEILNFQVWSYNPTFAEEIVASIIERMESTGVVDFFNREDEVPVAPSVFVANGRYETGALQLLLKSKPGVTQYRLTGESTRVEGGEKQVFDQVVTVPAEYQDSEWVPVELKTGTLFDAHLYVTNDYTEDVDQVYISDGAWGHIIEDPEEVEVELFTVLPHTEQEAESDQFFIERGIHFKGMIGADVLFFRHFMPGGQAVDLSDYDYVAFNARGKGRVTIQLESPYGGNKVLGREIVLGPDNQQYGIRLSDFENQPGVEGGVEHDGFTTISFSADAEGNDFGEFEFVVEDVFFGKGQPVSREDAGGIPAEFTLKQNYPNPFAGVTTIEFDVPEPAHVHITLFDLLGRKVFDIVDQAYITGKHKVQLSSEALASGMYMYKMEANDQVFIETMHVVR